MKKIFALLLLISCSTSSNYKIVVLDNGSKGYVITCFENRENCEREAEKLCNNNYEVHKFKLRQTLKDKPMGMQSSDLGIDDDFETESVSVFDMTVSCQTIKN